jgi:adenosylhomocysteine nucleosidase
MSAAYLVCFAVKEEAKPCRHLLSGRSDIEIVLTGMGMQQAGASVRHALMHHSPQIVFSCGFAGALRQDLQPGTVIFDRATTGLSWVPQLESLGARPALFASIDRVVTTAKEKAALRATSGCDAVEMESEAIREACAARGLECVTLRVISDAADDDLPLDFNLITGPDGRLNSTRLTGAILRAPWKIPALLRLGRNSALAARGLAHVLSAILKPLP